MVPQKHRFRRAPGSALVSVLALVLVGGVAGPVHAQRHDLTPYDPGQAPFVGPGQGPTLFAPPAPVVRTRHWYGYQIMGADVASIVLMLAARQSTSIGAAAFFVAPPVIHGLHGNTGMAIASPLMRVGLPLFGAVVGASAESCSSSQEDSFCGLGGAIAGLGIGLITAMVLDYSLAWKVREVPSGLVQAAPSPRPPRFRLTSAGVAPTSSGASLVLGGRF